MAPPIPPTPPPSTPTAIKVVGAVSSEDMARISEQLWWLTEWANFLDSIDWTGIPRKPGPATVPPPKPPAWP